MNAHVVDVLIVGAGPSGLSAALFLYRAGIQNIRIIDKSPIRVQTGHASGLQPRTEEILRSAGLIASLEAGSGQVVETAFWTMDSENNGIQRLRIVPEVVSATAYPKWIIQHQGRAEKVLNEQIEGYGLSVSRPMEYLYHEYTGAGLTPLRIYIKNTVQGTTEIWSCRYLLAADGANSPVRSNSGVRSNILQGLDSWAVADAAIDTDFPDFRRRAAIFSRLGNFVLLPSPHDTIRIYMLLQPAEREELDASILEVGPNNGNLSMTQNRNRITLIDILSNRVQQIMQPYRMEFKKVEWAGRYNVAQHVIDRYWDGRNVIFLGDCAHTHSPRVSQGMNTGMQDANSLFWRLSLILQGRAIDPTELLGSYHIERNHIARQVIQFEGVFESIFESQDRVVSPGFDSAWRRIQDFTSGCGHQYPANITIDGNVLPSLINQNALEPLTPGKRLLPLTLTRHIDGWIVSSLDVMPVNGQFREVIFADNISTEPARSQFRRVFDYLTSNGSAASNHNGDPPNGTWEFEDSQTSSISNGERIIDIMVIHTANHLDIELSPEYDPWKYGFFEDPNGQEHAKHGADLTKVTIVIVRPDGVIGMVCDAETMEARVPQYFNRFMGSGEEF